MVNIDPYVRHMIVCNDIATDPNDPNKLNIKGLVHAIRLKPPIRLPAVIDQLCVLLYLTGGRGAGDFQILGLEADTNRFAFGSNFNRIVYPSDPLELVVCSFRLRRCVVPSAGLYWIQLWSSGRMLNEQPVTVR